MGTEEEDRRTDRLHVSLSEDKKGDVEDVADSHYGGNVSRLIRCAVETERLQLEEDEMVERELMQSRIEEIKRELKDITNILEGSVEEIQTLQNGVDQTTIMSNAVSNPGKSTKSSQAIHDIVGILAESDHPVSLKTIAAESNCELVDLHQKMGILIDKGMVESIGNGSEQIQYKLTDATNE